jgi:small subunit ribosomal protein S4
LGPKNALARRPYPPGAHGPGKRPRKQSEYGLQLREKQKAKAIYGVLERQFRGYYEAAARSKDDTSAKLMELLERRLDNVVFRLGLADSRRQARQYVSHGHVTVDDAKLSIPSYQVSKGAKIRLNLDREPTEMDLPIWLRRSGKTLEGEVTQLPSRDQIPTELEEQLIVEFYSR